MIRTLRTIGFAAALALVAGQAQAVSSIQFVWESTNAPTITVSSVTDTLIQGEIEATADAAGISAIFISFAFDEDGLDELNIAPEGSFPRGPLSAATGGGGQEGPGTGGGGNFFGFAPGLPGYTQVADESGIGTPGLIGSFDIVSISGGFKNKTKRFGSVFFTTNALNVVDDGVDVQIVVLNNAFDDVTDSGGTVISDTVVLGGGIVNSGRPPSVPEPTAALLIVSGLAGLAFAGRRNRN